MYDLLSKLAQEMVFQLILISAIGALLGEATKEIDDNKDMVIYEFAIKAMGSAFMGIVAGLIASYWKESREFACGITGMVSFLGYKRTTKLSTRAIEKLSD